MTPSHPSDLAWRTLGCFHPLGAPENAGLASPAVLGSWKLRGSPHPFAPLGPGSFSGTTQRGGLLRFRLLDSNLKARHRPLCSENRETPALRQGSARGAASGGPEPRQGLTSTQPSRFALGEPLVSQPGEFLFYVGRKKLAPIDQTLFQIFFV